MGIELISVLEVWGAHTATEVSYAARQSIAAAGGRNLARFALMFWR